MDSPDALPSPDRRAEAGLQFDPATRRLSMGEVTIALGGEHSNGDTEGDNRSVLDGYVHLAARCRGDSVAHLVDVRHADVEALASALDLDADGLASEVAAVLGASRERAAAMVEHLRSHRIVSGLGRIAQTTPPADL